MRVTGGGMPFSELFRLLRSRSSDRIDIGRCNLLFHSPVLLVYSRYPCYVMLRL